jgi:hypothetical protein
MFVDLCIIVQFIQKNPTRCNSVSEFIIPYLYEDQHISGETAHHQEPKTALAASCLHTWKVVRCVVAGRCQAEYTLPEYANQRLLVQF